MLIEILHRTTNPPVRGVMLIEILHRTTNPPGNKFPLLIAKVHLSGLKFLSSPMQEDFRYQPGILIPGGLWALVKNLS